MEEFHRYPLRLSNPSWTDGGSSSSRAGCVSGVIGPNFEDLLDRLKVLAGNLFRARGETVADIEIVGLETGVTRVSLNAYSKSQ